MIETKEKKSITKRQNRNSIVRLIISNFDEEKIKEVKILYNKRGGVDTLKIEMDALKYDESIKGKKQIDFNISHGYNMRDEDRYIDGEILEKDNYMSVDRFKIYRDETGKKSLIIEKYKYGRAYKKYRLSLYCEMLGKKDGKKEKIKVYGEVEDLLMEEESLKRARLASSNRILLDREAIDFYRTIVDDEFIEIDSREIYKINKYLDYRSNMILYYQIINNSFVEDFNIILGSSYGEIWDISRGIEILKGVDSELEDIDIKELSNCKNEIKEDLINLIGINKDVKNRKGKINTFEANINIPSKRKFNLIDEQRKVIRCLEEDKERIVERLRKEKENYLNNMSLFYDNSILNLGLASFIEQHNKKIDGKIEKNIKKIGREKDKKSKKEEYIKALERTNIDLEDKKIKLSKEDIKNDIENIIKLLSCFRHSLYHYDYKFFRDLYSGKDICIGGENKDTESMRDLLDLKIFEELEKVKIINNESRTSYLKEDTDLYVLGQVINAREVLEVYNDLANSKNGFNKFVNYHIDKYLEEDKSSRDRFTSNFFGSEGYKIKLLKLRDGQKTNKKLCKRIDKLLKSYDNLEIKDKKIKRLYYSDIHQSGEYKFLYNKRKKLMAENSSYIRTNKSEKYGNKIDENNKTISELNKNMKEITDLNSRFRLEIKMQFAFGYLKKNYKFSEDGIKDFKDKFNNSDEKKSLSEKEFFEIMNIDNSNLYYFINKDYVFSQDNILDKASSNNLVRFYVLIYNLLPQEIRGDFLGFVKKHYYDVKHVDFIDSDIDLENRNRFFHNLRLFEKNSKNLTLIKYSFIDSVNDSKTLESVKSAIEKTKQNYSFVDYEYYTRLTKIDMDERLIKALIMALMNYYQIVFKLINDLEIELLYELKIKMEKEDNKEVGSLEDVKKDLAGEGKSHYNFRSLIYRVLDINKKKETIEIENFINIRNSISHINNEEMYGEHIEDCMIDYKKKDKNGKIEKEQGYHNRSISNIVERGYLDIVDSFETANNKKLNNLSYNILNDYYMKKEHLTYNLLLDILDNKMYRISNKDKLEEFYYKYDIELLLKELIKNEKILKDIDKNKKENSNKVRVIKRKISDIEGKIKAILIRDIKKTPYSIIKNGEIRYLILDSKEGSEDPIIEEVRFENIESNNYKMLDRCEGKSDLFNISLQDDNKVIIEYNGSKSIEDKIINLDEGYSKKLRF